MKLRDLGTFGSLALIWGFSFFFLVKTLAAFGWVGTSSFRSIIAGLTVLAIMRLQGRPFALAAHWKELAVLGLVASALQYLGIAYGAPRIGTAMSAILISTIPLFAMVISRVCGVERLSSIRLVGLLLGLLGVVLLVGFPVMPVTPDFLVGVASVMFGCAAAASGSVYANVRLSKADPWTVTAGSFFAGGVMLLPLVYFVPLPRTPMALDFVWLLLLGGLVTGIGYLQYFKLVQAIGPTRAVSVEFVVTVIAVSVGAVLLGERLSVVQLFGAAVVLLGCALVLGLLPRQLYRAAQQEP